MGFTDALANVAPKPRRLRIDEVLDVLDEDIAKEALAALTDLTIPARQVARAFGDDDIGHPVSDNAVIKWRERNTASA